MVTANQGFNSTMVRLKVIISRLLNRLPVCFNSTMVRLKGFRESPSAMEENPFQFHNGSIKRSQIMKAAIMVEQFQFHNGSIKSESKIANDPTRQQFQFHNGSIKSIRQCYFSIRLNGFNSTMVRLKVTPPFKTQAGQTMFQFHNGSIKSARCSYTID